MDLWTGYHDIYKNILFLFNIIRCIIMYLRQHTEHAHRNLSLLQQKLQCFVSLTYTSQSTEVPPSSLHTPYNVVCITVVANNGKTWLTFEGEVCPIGGGCEWQDVSLESSQCTRGSTVNLCAHKVEKFNRTYSARKNEITSVNIIDYEQL